MKNRFGFTLAEVLVTIGIIGVIAALTTPSLISNTGRVQTGPALAKFVNTFQNATQKMLVEQSRPYLSNPLDTDMLAKYIVMSPMSKEHNFSNGSNQASYSFTFNGKKYYGPDGKQYVEVINGDAWLLNDGMLVSFFPAQETAMLVNKGAYKELIGLCLVDINGYKKPNQAAKDVYAFLIDSSGVLIPVGSSAHKYVEADPILTQYGDIKTDYNESCDMKAYALTSNFACTGELADNGWKEEEE